MPEHRPHKVHVFKGKVFVDTDKMWLLRNRYGVKGLAREIGINKRGLYRQYEIGIFRQTEEVSEMVDKLCKGL